MIIGDQIAATKKNYKNFRSLDKFQLLKTILTNHNALVYTFSNITQNALNSKWVIILKLKFL